MPTIEENIQRFEELLGSVQRNGMDKLMNYIRKKTDFYSAPASTRFHLSCEGGLLQHSLNVYMIASWRKKRTRYGRASLPESRTKV